MEIEIIMGMVGLGVVGYTIYHNGHDSPSSNGNNFLGKILDSKGLVTNPSNNTHTQPNEMIPHKANKPQPINTPHHHLQKTYATVLQRTSSFYKNHSFDTSVVAEQTANNVLRYGTSKTKTQTLTSSIGNHAVAIYTANNKVIGGSDLSGLRSLSSQGASNAQTAYNINKAVGFNFVGY